MKISIVTIYDDNNYGNRLQNYALSKVLTEMNHEVNTIKNSCEPLKKISILKWVYRKLYSKARKREHRRRKFTDFTDIYIPTTFENYCTSDLKRLNEIETDCIIIGSDQIWNYNFRGSSFGAFEFGDFAKPKKVISYAASIGVSNIKDEFLPIFAKGMLKLTNISVREQKAKEILAEVTDKNIDVVLDPTMLVSAKDWHSIAKKPSFISNKKYILTYFLGEVDQELANYLKKKINETGYELIMINNDITNMAYSTGPSEFLYLFENAEYIYTDSFHACVFSILFKKEFFVFERNSKGMATMNSRIDTLLNMFDLSDRSIKDLSMLGNHTRIAYDGVECILNAKIENSLNYLSNAISDCTK